MVHLWSLDSGKSRGRNQCGSNRGVQKQGYGSILNVVQQLIKAQLPKCQLALVTSGAQAVSRSKEEVLHVEQASVWGLGQVIAREYPSLNCVRIDLDRGEAYSESYAEVLLSELGEEQREETQVAYREGKRFVSRLVRSERESKCRSPLSG